MNDFVNKFNANNPDPQEGLDPNDPNYVEPDEVDPDPDNPIEEPPEPTIEDTVADLAKGMTLISEQMKVLMTGGAQPASASAPPEPKEIQPVTFIADAEEAAQMGLGEDVNVKALNVLLNKVVTESVSVGKDVIAPEILTSVNATNQQERVLNKFYDGVKDLEDVQPFVETMVQRYRQGYPDQPLQWVLENAEAYVRNATGRAKGGKPTGKGTPRVPKAKGGGSYRGTQKKSGMKRILEAHNKV